MSLPPPLTEAVVKALDSLFSHPRMIVLMKGYGPVPHSVQTLEEKSLEKFFRVVADVVMRARYSTPTLSHGGYRVVPEREVLRSPCFVCRAELPPAHGPHCPRVTDGEGRSYCPKHSEELLPGYASLLSEYVEWRQKRQEAIDVLMEKPE